MKYTKKLYNADFTSGRIVRPKNQTFRFFTDLMISPWYLFLFVVVCAFYPTALFADSYRYLRLQYLRLNNDKMPLQQRLNMSIQNMRDILTN